ncbi:MAG: multicopper oxidase family protein [Magnetovibrio sp.]|nr:multicopper oxidase family protein [Magnetovibrio sp.]
MTHIHLPQSISRRTVLSGLVGSAALTLLPLPSLAATPNVREFSLKAQPAKASILPDKYGKTPVFSYNGQIPGQTLRVTQGDTVRIHFENKLDEPTTVHWHGLRIPIGMDGVPDISQKPVAPGESFTYEFRVPDAGTYWYHPHVNTSEQMAKGLSGVFIIDEKEPYKVDREETWVLDDWRFNQDATIRNDFGRGMDVSHGGRTGNVITVNGKLPGTFPVRAGERIRIRLANVANAKIFILRFEHHKPHVIALDGHPVEPHLPKDNQLIIAPGQRVDVVLDCSGKPGDTFSVIDDLYQGEVYRMIDGVYSDATPVRAKAQGPVVALPDNPLSPLDMGSAVRHEITIDGGAMGSMQGAEFKGTYYPIGELVKYGRVWALNGVAAHTTAMAPILTAKLGSTNVITVRNDTGFPHPMHLHGHAFRILKTNGVDKPHQPWVDTVLMEPRGTAEIAFVADNPGDWLFHCHILEHVIGGMLSVIRVA